MVSGYTRNIYSPAMYVLASLYDNRTHTQFYQFESSKQSSRSGSYNHSLLPSLHILIFSVNESFIFRFFIHIYSDFQIDVYCPLPCINTLLQHTHMLDCPHVHTLIRSYEPFYLLFIGCLFGQYPYLKFMYHFTDFIFLTKIRIIKKRIKTISKLLFIATEECIEFISEQTRALSVLFYIKLNLIKNFLTSFF